MEPLISIVDDDEPVREALRRVLAAHGLETAVFASGKQLLASDQLPRMSCLIVDVKMPGMTGLALHHRLMAEGHHIPTILITGGATASGRKRAKPCSTMFVWRWRAAPPAMAGRWSDRTPSRRAMAVEPMPVS